MALTLTARRKAAFSLGLGVIYAGSDEFHQYFVPGRECGFNDWVADSIGLASGIVICYTFLARKGAVK